jgi:hypothetical protein
MKLGRKFQEGGAMPAGAPAAAPQGGEDPMAMLMQGAEQAVSAQDCEIAMQVCQMLLELAGGGAPAEAAPAEFPRFYYRWYDLYTSPWYTYQHLRH